MRKYLKYYKIVLTYLENYKNINIKILQIYYSFKVK